MFIEYLILDSSNFVLSSPVNIDGTIVYGVSSLGLGSSLGNVSKVHGNELLVGEVGELVHGNGELSVSVRLDELQVFEPDVVSVVVNIILRVGWLVLSSPGLVEFKVRVLGQLQGNISGLGELTSELTVVD